MKRNLNITGIRNRIKPVRKNNIVQKTDTNGMNKISNIDSQERIISIEGLGKNGRLGNQLFQVASTIGIANKNQAKPVFESWYCTYTNKDISSFFKNKLEYRKQIIPSWRYIENGFNFNRIPYRNNMVIKGYLQTEKYFKECKDLIYHYFEPNDILYNNIKNKYGELDLENKKVCSVHIRRGDYVNHRIHGVCDLDYYNRSMAYMKEKINIDYFLIFSDDIEWCKKNVTGDNIKYSEGLIDLEDLFLMSLCDNHIISNSSFSWWGSWLCKKNNKKIISPSRWFKEGSNINDVDIFNENFIRL
jgi:hypothetical protein